MKEKFQHMMETSAKQSSASGSLSYWIGSAVVALGGGGYVAYRLWELGHTLGPVWPRWCLCWSASMICGWSFTNALPIANGVKSK